MNTYDAETVVAVGGNRWTTPDGQHDRIYIDRPLWMSWVGLEITQYKSGSIRYASLNGEKISNSEADRIWHAFRHVYVDVATGELTIQSMTHRPVLRVVSMDEMIGRIRAGLDNAIKALADAVVHRLAFPEPDWYGKPIPDLETKATGVVLDQILTDHLYPHLYLAALDISVDLETLTGSITRLKNGKEVMAIEVTRL